MSAVKTAGSRLRNRTGIRGNRRLSLARAVGSTLLATVCGSSAASSQSGYPQRTVSLIVPFAAGGATDALTRILVTGMRSSMDGKVIVENRPGALTQIGIRRR